MDIQQIIYNYYWIKCTRVSVSPLLWRKGLNTKTCCHRTKINLRVVTLTQHGARLHHTTLSLIIFQ